MSSISFNNSSIVMCTGCEVWYRAQVTEVVSTSSEGDSFRPERWCFTCLSGVDKNTEAALDDLNASLSEGLDEWDEERDEHSDD